LTAVLARVRRGLGAGLAAGFLAGLPAGTAAAADDERIGLFRAVCFDALPTLAGTAAAFEQAGLAERPAPDGPREGAARHFGDAADGPDGVLVTGTEIAGLPAAMCRLEDTGLPPTEAAEGVAALHALAVGSAGGEEAVTHACPGNDARRVCQWFWTLGRHCIGMSAAVGRQDGVGSIGIVTLTRADPPARSCAEIGG